MKYILALVLFLASSVSFAESRYAHSTFNEDAVIAPGLNCRALRQNLEMIEQMIESGKDSLLEQMSPNIPKDSYTAYMKIINGVRALVSSNGDNTDPLDDAIAACFKK
jgi:hypothetical protein